MSRVTDRRPPLVGRRAELAALEDVVRTARRGGRLAVVEGEPGIGKSRLVEAAIVAARDAGLAVNSSRAEELESHRPFAAIVDCLGREHFDDQLGAGELRPDLAGERQFRVGETVLERLDEQCAQGPVVVAIEDLHWADAGTLGVVARVAAEIDQFPTALVLSVRPQPRRPELERLLGLLAARGATHVRLGPLDEESSTQLVESLVGAHPGDRLVRQAARAGGNPLFVCELVGALLADGAITRGDAGAELIAAAGAPSLPLTILHRLSFTSPEVLDLLGLASVLGASFAVDDLALLAGRPVSALVAALRSAQRAGVLAERGERLAFRHELIRDALYEDMPLAVRRGLHRELATALANAGEPAERVAEHLVRGAVPGDERGAASVAAAARDLVGRAPGLAVDLYRQAIELSAVREAMRAQLLPELAEALVAAGLHGEGEQACREALGRELDPQWAGRLRLQLLYLLLRQARIADAIRDGEQGLATGTLLGRDRERTRALVAVARVNAQDVAPAVREASALLQASEDELARALAANTLAMAAIGRGAFTEAAELIAPSVHWVEQRGSRAAYEARPHLTLSPMLIRLDRFEDAQVTLRRGRRAAESLGVVDALPTFHYQQALLDFSRGNLGDAVAELDTRTRLVEHAEVGWHLPAQTLHALIAIHRDDLLEAERHVAVAEREAATGGSAHGADRMVLARALLLEAGNGPAVALDAIAGTVDAMAAAGAATVLPVLGPALARLAAATGEPARAAWVVPQLRRIAELNPGAPSLEAYVRQARGLLDGDLDAILAAVELLRGSGRALETARAAEDAAALGGEGRELLRRAAETYARCGALRDLARVEAALRGRGIRSGVRGPRRRSVTGWESLTETELKVVRLVTERLTNPEIAQRMFISRRTVQTHVSHALTKVGVATRRELAAVAARHVGWRLRIEGVDE